VSQQLPPDLVERVLTRLRLSQRPNADHEGLQAIYGEWCQAVPCDNVLKLIHLQSNDPAPLPGTDANDFFQSWLKYGTGGTCWSGNGALHALLVSLGFAASRGVATVLVAPDLPPNHGTVIVECDGTSYLVDASMLFSTPLGLQDEPLSAAIHPAWGARIYKRDGLWHIWWRPLNYLEGLECRLNYMPATIDEFQTRYEQTRGWSPFNYELMVRKIQGDSLLGISLGERVEIDKTGGIHHDRLSEAGRHEFLLELGYAEEIICKLPPDRPTPPPPWSETARNSMSQLSS
jgi:N-hydroxyarylamine O-acetyltransferase